MVVWGSISRPVVLTFGSSCCRFVLVDQASEYGSALDLRAALVWNRAVRPWREELASSMGTASVVVRDILLKHGTQVTFVNDQNAIGDLAPDRPDEPLGIAVRSRTSGRNLDYLDIRIGEDGIK
jgi:hypothetical protein